MQSCQTINDHAIPVSNLHNPFKVVGGGTIKRSEARTGQLLGRSGEMRSQPIIEVSWQNIEKSPVARKLLPISNQNNGMQQHSLTSIKQLSSFME